MSVCRNFIVLITILLISPNLSAQDLNIRPYKIPTIGFDELIAAKNNTKFYSVQETIEQNQIITRGASKNVFSKALPSVVKILTNEGHGTGVIVSAADNGYILTNYHVVEDYLTVGIVFPEDSGEEPIILGEVIRVDEISDLAIIGINSKKDGIKALEFNFGGILVGDDVHAIGHPMGEDWTYTRGYVSQKREKYQWSGDLGKHHVADVIQTQTPISSGNSGGPLLDNKGKLVGINSFGSTNAQGLNFAVANSTIFEFLERDEDVLAEPIPKDLTEGLVKTGDENGNGKPDIYLWDYSDNGLIDMVGIDKNEDFEIELILIDENENEIFEITIRWDMLDGNEIAIYEIDENEDEEIESIGFDLDLDGNLDKIVSADKINS